MNQRWRRWGHQSVKREENWRGAVLGSNGAVFFFFFLPLRLLWKYCVAKLCYVAVFNPSLSSSWNALLTSLYLPNVGMFFKTVLRHHLYWEFSPEHLDWSNRSVSILSISLFVLKVQKFVHYMKFIYFYVCRYTFSFLKAGTIFYASVSSMVFGTQEDFNKYLKDLVGKWDKQWKYSNLQFLIPFPHTIVKLTPINLWTLNVDFYIYSPLILSFKILKKNSVIIPPVMI